MLLVRGSRLMCAANCAASSPLVLPAPASNDPAGHGAVASKYNSSTSTGTSSIDHFLASTPIFTATHPSVIRFAISSVERTPTTLSSHDDTYYAPISTLQSALAPHLDKARALEGVLAERVAQREKAGKLRVLGKAIISSSKDTKPKPTVHVRAALPKVSL